MIKQMAVPMKVQNFVFQNTRNTNNPQLKAIGELVLIVFYFLLHIGEYMHHTTQGCTQQFWLCDIQVFAVDQLISLEQLAMHAEQINLVSLTIQNPKNGWKGETISHHALHKGDTLCCPVKAVVEQVMDMVRMQATEDTLICAFHNAVSLPWQQVHSSHIVNAVKDVVKP